MQDDITYNQLIIFRENTFFICKQVKRSFIEKGKLILIIEDSKKITISVKGIDASGNRNRINDRISMATEKGFYIPEKSIMHYAKEKRVEYLLVRW